MSLAQEIAALCQVVLSCQTPTPQLLEAIRDEQASCQSYYAVCMTKGSRSLSQKENLNVCIASRPAQLLLDKADRAAAMIKARKRIEYHRDNPTTSGSAE